MATRAERTEAYLSVVMALAKAAEIDGYLERASIAKAMDALGPVISDVNPMVAGRAIRFRNGPLLRDHQPVAIHLQKDPEPIQWLFKDTEVLHWRIGNITLSTFLVNTARQRIGARNPDALNGFGDTSYGLVTHNNQGYFVVTLYPNKED